MENHKQEHAHEHRTPHTGYLHSMDTSMGLDGPGMRLVVYLQGCPLRCRYCHNPDTWTSPPLAGTPTRVDEIFLKALRYKTFFDASEGGVTVSGGEPLLQAPFVADLFTALRAAEIRTCLDTSGFLPDGIPESELDRLLAVTDLVLLDIKHMDPETHLALTGQSNARIHRFLDQLQSANIPVWFRYVVVPGVTDDEDSVRGFNRLALAYPHTVHAELLPFHQLGEFKWQELGLPYTLAEILPPTPERMAHLEGLR